LITIIQKLFFLLTEVSPVIVGGTSETVSTVIEGGQTVVENVSEAPAGGAFSTLTMLLIYAAVFGAAYFFIFRPQRKRDKEMKEMQSNLRVGDNVVTTAGLYGRIVDVGEDVFVVEFGSNRGVRIPVRKSDISGVKDPKLTPPPVIEAKD